MLTNSHLVCRAGDLGVAPDVLTTHASHLASGGLRASDLDDDHRPSSRRAVVLEVAGATPRAAHHLLGGRATHVGAARDPLGAGSVQHEAVAAA